MVINQTCILSSLFFLIMKDNLKKNKLDKVKINKYFLLNVFVLIKEMCINDELLGEKHRGKGQGKAMCIPRK